MIDLWMTQFTDTMPRVCGVEYSALEKRCLQALIDIVVRNEPHVHCAPAALALSSSKYNEGNVNDEQTD